MQEYCDSQSIDYQVTSLELVAAFVEAQRHLSSTRKAIYMRWMRELGVLQEWIELD